ncbi:unnamed protein product [Kuraishia capsulata CBS 1993]|uniref:Ubiquitin carboxyl-terminal hydrolase n=1 Tax=Kuraishia capsulata CBS 1993 TaxID=1382522 RepID=W6MSK5_9ASCO|nr:uncharacterized protein KUCA_T00005351001 [Kuraishia capsulata CBS 1993]CDK29363.1 unnamed protein product [Kuraishia capsulata CBS 1993]
MTADSAVPSSGASGLKSLTALTLLVDELIEDYTVTPLSISEYLEKAVNCYSEYSRNVKFLKNPQSQQQANYEELFVYYTAASRILSVVIPSLPEYRTFEGNTQDPKFGLFSDFTELLYAERNRMDSIKAYIRTHSLPDRDDELLTRLRNLKAHSSVSVESESKTKSHTQLESRVTSGFKTKTQSVSQSQSQSQSQSRSQSPVKASTTPAIAAPNPQALKAKFDAIETSISAKALNSLLSLSPSDVLVIDLRRRRDFDNNHVEFPGINLLSIEPVAIRPDYSASDVQKMSLATNPDSERQLFENRSQFELIVVYDWSSTTSAFDTITLRFLNILKTRSSTAYLKRQPVLLEGGFNEWLQLNEDGLQGYIPHGEIIQPIDIPSKPMLFRKNSLARRSSQINEPERLEDAYYRKQPEQYSSRSSSVSVPGSPGPGYVRTVNEFFASPNREHSPSQNEAISPVFPHQFAPPSHKASVRKSSAGSSLSQPPSQSPVPPPKVLTRPKPVALSKSEHSTTLLNAPSKTRSFQEKLDVMTGLANLGNTCYMNCTLQCLFGTKKFDEFFLNGSYKSHININSRLGSKGILANEFNGLVTEIFIKSNHSHPTYISPLRFRKIIASLSSSFRTSEQQDCSEFLNFLLDGLHEDLNECGNHPPLPELTKEEEFRREKLAIRVASTIEWEKYLKTNFSIVVDIFQGQYLSRLQCTVCKNTSTTYNAYSILSLPIPETSARTKISLGQCFDQFCAPEILDGDDRWMCPHCKVKNRTTKTMMISRLPEVLIVHLKRFKLGSQITKLNTFIDYPLELSLDKYWPKVQTEQEMHQLAALPMRNQMAPFNYKLFGVVNHYGNLATGHYTAYVDKREDGWCYFDDTKVTKRRPLDKVINADAYVLFYARV